MSVTAVRTVHTMRGAAVVCCVAVVVTVVAELKGVLHLFVAAVRDIGALRPARVRHAWVGVFVLVEAVVARFIGLTLHDGIATMRAFKTRIGAPVVFTCVQVFTQVALFTIASVGRPIPAARAQGAQVGATFVAWIRAVVGAVVAVFVVILDAVTAYRVVVAIIVANAAAADVGAIAVLRAVTNVVTAVRSRLAIVSAPIGYV